MSTDIKRHPLAIAWDKWLASKEGQECRAANTLAHNTNVYLENRLHRAFDAGAAHFDEVVAALKRFRKEGHFSACGCDVCQQANKALAVVKTDSGDETKPND